MITVIVGRDDCYAVSLAGAKLWIMEDLGRRLYIVMADADRLYTVNSREDARKVLDRLLECDDKVLDCYPHIRLESESLGMKGAVLTYKLHWTVHIDDIVRTAIGTGNEPRG